MSETEDQRFAPPQAHVEDLAPDGPVPAGRGERFLAVLVDTLLAFAGGWAISQIPVLGTMVQAQQKDAAAAGLWALNPLSLLIGVPVFLLIQAWPLLTRGQTVGKMLLKIRIVRPDGSKPDAWRLLGLRYGIGLLTGVTAGVAMIYGLVDSLLIFRESRKCLHDTIADTQVIKL